MKQTITPPELVAPRGFNHGFLCSGGRTLFLAGQDASDIRYTGEVMLHAHGMVWQVHLKVDCTWDYPVLDSGVMMYPDFMVFLIL